MTRASQLLSAILILMMPCLSVAQGSVTPDKEEAISRIFSALPVEASLNEVSKDLNQQFSQNPFGLPTDKNDQMMQIFRKAFNTDSLSESAHHSLEKQYKPAFADSVLEWLDTPTADSVMSQEHEFYTIQGMRKRIISKYEYEQNPPPEDRQEIVRSLINAQNAVNSEVRSQTIIFRALVSAFSVLSDQRSFNESQIDDIVGNFNSRIQGQIEQELSNQLLLMYHDVDTTMLKDYRTFYNSPTGQWLSDARSEAVHTAFQEAADRFLSDVREL